MVAASSAALPRALRGASGSSTPGNRLPQPTTQPAVVHAPGQPTRWHTTVSKQPGYLLRLIPPWRYRQELLPGNLLPLILPCIPPRNYRRVTYPRATYRRGILPRDGSRAQRAGDSDVGANDKGAGDDPGDWVDAH